MDNISNLLTIIILITAFGFIVLFAETRRKQAMQEANALVDLRTKEAAEHYAQESEKHLTELREIKELLKKISWHLDRK